MVIGLMLRDESSLVAEFVQMGLLLDFYGGLLTERQLLACRLYFGENLSLGEIASELAISRQAVHDSVRRAAGALLGYEEKLGLLTRFKEQQDELRVLRELLATGNIASANDLLDRLII